MKNVTVKRMSTNEVNVSQRNVWYEVYVDGKFHTSTEDVIVAIDLRDKLQAESK